MRIDLICEVSGGDTEAVAVFQDYLCIEAREALSTRQGVMVALVGADQPTAGRWVRLEVMVRNSNTAVAIASWGEAGTKRGEGRRLESGIDDATINRSFVKNLAGMLAREVPLEF